MARPGSTGSGTHDTLLHRLQPLRDRLSEDCIDVLAMDVEIMVAGKPRKKKCSTSLSSTPRAACSARFVRRRARRRV